MHGTKYEESDLRLIRVVDRIGTLHAELWWGDDGQLRRLEVTGAAVDGAVVSHPLLGAAHAVGTTAMTAIAWAAPTEIPAIAEPGRLPLGAGGAILNTISLLAQRAGVPGLRYAGPYPTAALWRALLRSFRCTAGEAEFTRGGLERALRVAREPIAIDFVPAPNERIAITGGFVELRDDLERVVIDGVTYEPSGSPARLIDDRGSPPGGSAAEGRRGWIDDRGSPPGGSAAEGRRGWINDGDRHCEVWFGDAPYARVATLTAGGALVAGPHPIPPCASPVIGREFPLALRAAIAELVADAVAAPLAADARALCAGTPLYWADLGARAAREQPAGFAVHAALWERIAPLGLGRLALALAEALVPVVTAAVIQRAAAAAGGDDRVRQPS